MNLGIITIFFDGYGEFIPEWCKSIKNLNKKPKQITLVASGNNHGLAQSKKCLNLLKDIEIVKIIYVKDIKTIGTLRNIAVEETPNEWILYFSADDVILPNAINEFEKCNDADVIATKYRMIKDGNSSSEITPIPEEKKIKNWQSYYINSGYVVFRRKIWQRLPFIDSNYPNFPFLFKLYKVGAKFIPTKEDCIEYRKRKKSMSGKMTQKDYEAAVKIINHYASR